MKHHFHVVVAHMVHHMMQKHVKVVAHRTKIVTFETSRPRNLRIIIKSPPEVSNSQKGSWEEVRVFHHDVAPNGRNNEVKTLVKMVARFLSLCQSYCFIFFLFAIIVEEIPR